MILSSYLASRYAQDTPLSLSASLAFEQSYGPIDGDSASVAELCALLSVLSGIPLRQSLAVTGSVNQHGRVQAVGGVNEKIEGFFDICAERGLAHGQGVLLPAANVVHLMLCDDVRDAVAAGMFAVYPITTIDEAVALMTGRAAGKADAHGDFESGRSIIAWPSGCARSSRSVGARPATGKKMTKSAIMNEAGPPIRRVVVILDSGRGSHALLDEAVAMAAREGAELVGLFVEDTDWLRAASLPFGGEVSRASGRLRSIDSEAAERR